MSQDADHELAKLWVEAIERYTSVTGIDLRTDPNVIRVTSGHDLVSKIETQQAQFAKFREKRAALWKVFDQIGRVVETITSIASDSVAQAFPPSSVIFAAVSYLIKRAKDVNTAYDSILDLLECLKVFITSIGLHAQYPILPQLREIFVKKLSCFLVILGISAKLIKDGKAYRVLKNIVHGGDGSGLQAQINELETLSKHEVTLINSLSLTSLNAQSATLTAVATNIAVNTVALNRLVETRSPHDIDEGPEAQLHTLEERLDPELSVDTDYENTKNDLLPGTGDWIRSDATFREWVDKSTSCLWVSGGPGQGKTYLSASVVRWLMEKYLQEDNHASQTRVAYFFCRGSNERTQLFSVILRTLAYQIARDDLAYRAYLLKSFKRDSETRADIAHSWKILFEKFFADKNTQSRLCIVIDGLDEAVNKGPEGVQTFLRSLRLGFQNSVSLRLKILLVGRPEMDYMVDYNLGALASTIELSDRHKSDVVKYAKNQLSRARNLSRVSPTFREEIVEVLSQRTFLWVKLACKEIASKNTEHKVRQALEAFPRDLRETIHHVLERFSESPADEIDDLNELLAWVTCAPRPLTLEETEEMMTIYSGGPVFGLEGLLRTRYSTFFTLIRRDGLSTADLQNKSRHALGNDTTTSAELNDIDFDSPKRGTTIHISHLVFLEYFRSEAKTTAVGVDIAKAKVHLLLRCLLLLCDGEKVDRWNCARMLSHAGYYWMDYLSKIDITSVSVDDKRSVATYLHGLFTDETALRHWCGGIEYRRLCGELFHTDTTTEAIVRWVTDEAIGPGEIWDWSEMVKADVKALFAPLIQYCTAKLFRDYSDDPLRWFYLIYAYLYRFESDLLKGRPRAVNLWNVTSDDVLAVIARIHPPEDSLVFARIGDLLRKVGDFGHAEEWYLKAAALSDPPGPGFRVTSGLARTYSHERKHDYRKAVEWGNRALAYYEDEFTKTADTLAWEIAEWTGLLYDANEVTLAEALVQWDSAFEHNSRNPTFAVAYLNQFEKWEQHTQAILMMKSFADVDWDPTDGVTHSFLVQIVHDVHAYQDEAELLLQRAARETNNIPWLIALYKTALAAAADLPGPRSNFLTANIVQSLLRSALLDDSRDEDYVIQLSEELLSRVRLSAPRRAGNNPDKVNRSLCEIYYQRALRAEKDGKDLDPYLDKLKQTADRMQTDADVFREEEGVSPMGRLSVFRVHAPDLLLGTWYRLHERENEAVPIFWRRISLAIDVLHDNIKENYDRAYEFLAFALMAAGDLRSCRAALHLVGGPVLDESRRVWPAETEESGINNSYKLPESVHTDRSRWTCDGPCSRGLFVPHGMHICVDGCLDKGFCSPCLGKLKRRELKYNVCSPDHHWLHTTREGMPDLEEGKVLFVADGEEPEVIMDREVWFDQLSEKWGIGTH